MTAPAKEVLSQAVDTDYDDYHKPDILIFQADFAPDETKTFTITAGKKRAYTREDFRAYGRFVRERFDDFAWENDRIAHRTYGKALITWKGEPLTSSSIDIWSKRTEKLIINDWYMIDNYHADHGDGVDVYSAGPTRGCGGNGIWSNGQLFIPTNFRLASARKWLKPGLSTAVTYWAGFAWDRAAKITSAESWNAYVDQFGERLRSPIEISHKKAEQ